MKLTRHEHVVEQIVILLLSLDNYEDRAHAIMDANDIMQRVEKGWWERAGSPHFNARMARIKRKLRL